MPSIPTLDDNLIQLLGIEALPDEKKVQLLENATKLIEKRIMLRFLETLSEEEKAEAEKVAAKPGKLLEIIVRKIPNIDQVVLEEAATLKEELMLATLEAPEDK